VATLMKVETSALVHSIRGETGLFAVYDFYSAFDPSTPGHAEVTDHCACVAGM